MSEPFLVRRTPDRPTLVVERPRLATASAAIGFLVEAGARDEPTELAGTAHYLEHMAFKGSPRRDVAALNQGFDRLGAIYNAFTSEEVTFYYGWVPAERLAGVGELLVDLLHPKLDPADLERERTVILEEIAMHLDRPEARLWDELLQAAFGAHPLGRRVLGTPETVARITPASMRAFLDEHYATGRVACLVAGAVEPEAAERLLDELWAAAAASAPPELRRRATPSAPPRAAAPRPDFFPARLRLPRPDLERQRVALAWPAPALSPLETAVAAEMLVRVLGDETGSRLFWGVRQKGLAEDVGASYAAFADTGLFVLHATTDPEKAPAVLDAFRRELERLAREDVAAEELERVRNKTLTDIVVAAESPFSRLGQMAEDWRLRRRLRTVPERIALVRAVTTATLREILAAWPLPGAAGGAPEVLATLGPREEL